GFTHGLVRELTSLVALILGVYATFSFSNIVAEWINIPNIPKEAYFAITFTGVLIGVFFLGRLVEKVVKLMIPALLNNLLGCLFGIAKVWVVCSVIIFFIQNVDSKNVILTEQMVESSFTYIYVEPVVPLIKGWFKF
ncbi:MAG: CvpA family protein, partial [Firmicutes bacterium]|nr:CvpA family protein [Bacillota bacterium]